MRRVLEMSVVAGRVSVALAGYLGSALFVVSCEKAQGEHGTAADTAPAPSSSTGAPVAASGTARAGADPTKTGSATSAPAPATVAVSAATSASAAAAKAAEKALAPAGKEKSCGEEIGAQRARVLVERCAEASAATHPPCNAMNPCQMMIDEIKRNCVLQKLTDSYCKEYGVTNPAPAKVAAASPDPGCRSDADCQPWEYCSDGICAAHGAFIHGGEEEQARKAEEALPSPASAKAPKSDAKSEKTKKTKAKAKK